MGTIDRKIIPPNWVREFIPGHLQGTVIDALRTSASQEYLEFFKERPEKQIKEALALPDDEAADYLYDLADMFPYSWPSDEHPNYEFCLDMLHVVDWQYVLFALKLWSKNER